MFRFPRSSPETVSDMPENFVQKSVNLSIAMLQMSMVRNLGVVVEPDSCKSLYRIASPSKNCWCLLGTSAASFAEKRPDITVTKIVKTHEFGWHPHLIPPSLSGVHAQCSKHVAALCGCYAARCLKESLSR